MAKVIAARNQLAMAKAKEYDATDKKNIDDLAAAYVKLYNAQKTMATSSKTSNQYTQASKSEGEAKAEIARIEGINSAYKAQAEAMTSVVNAKNALAMAEARQMDKDKQDKIN